MMQFNRRDFIRGSALAAASLVAGGCETTGAAGRYPAVTRTVAPRFRKPGEKLNIGVVGVGGKGWSDWMPMFKNGENIVALCDVDRNPINKALAELEKAGVKPSQVKCYSDFRKMLDECKNLDAVTVSTPDHMHAPAAIRAMKQGCHVFVQKPLVRTIWEARYFEKVAKSCGVVTQMGNQGSANNGLRRNAELLQAGVLGDVTEVHVWTNRPIWPQGIGRPEGSDPIPETLDWDSYLGTAPVRPFKAGVYHTFKWRGFFDFGTGAFGDMACHTMNLPFRGLRLGAVESAECIQIEGKNNETYPNKSIVRLTYAARGRLPRVTLYWYDGNLKPSAEIMPKVVATLGQVPNTGCLIMGSKGMVCSTNDYGADGYIAFNDEEKMKSMSKHEALTEEAIPAKFRRNTNGQYIEFVEACKGNDVCFSDVDHSVPMLESMLVGCVAQQVPGKLKWDSRKQEFANNAAANALVKPHIRPGWEF
ncbi:MAG TPA: Gfo/Idh/MocA family oxidoreductase [Kiritimatiellia bacterium]|nr:Gfo/Idh/MocA family oxidoreductase [Kiritimatiellia bacterium]